MTGSGVTGDESGETPASDESFARVLDAFKRDGCLLLVTGDVPPQVTARASRKLLGTPTAFRHRVLAATDPEAGDPGTHLPGTLTPASEGVTLVDARDAESPAAGIDAVADTILDALSETTSTDGESTGAVNGRGASADAGNVRFALATLTPYRGNGCLRRDVPRLLDDLHEAAHAVGAIGAVHLPLPDGHPDVETLTPHVDARIEVRDTDTALPEQRWYLPDHDTATNWVTM